MPTGYTAAVADGTITDLCTFALRCARGMGALIAMRDEPHDAPIPAAFEPQTRYHDEALVRLRAELDQLNGASPAEHAWHEKARRAEAEAYRAKYAANNAAQKSRYEAMIAKVRAWTGAPEGLKEFMLEQLQQSVQFDCGGDYLPAVPEEVEPAEWQALNKARILKDIAYHEGERAKEITRTQERNKWLSQLRASLSE